MDPQPYDLEAFKTRLLQILKTNDVKVGSAKAKTIEYGFINGLVAAYGEIPLLTLCVGSGRSILSLAITDTPAAT